MRFAALLGLLLAALPASADDFFQLSPGPLTNAHAELDNTDNCTKCHELGKGVTNFLCLDCHQHQPLRDAIKQKRGLHASFTKDCRTCHADHKGRDSFIVDWGPVGGRQSFKHQQTGFDLTGQHEKVACTACHKRKLKSGRTSFIDVPPDCDGCHKNPHGFTSQDLRKACTKCHTPGVAKKLTTADLFFDHAERGGIPLVGKHGQIDCVKCHEGAKMVKPAAGGRTCSNCHAKNSPHGKAFAKSKCQDCHSVEEGWPKTPFDHDTTGFPLKGEHKTKQCGQCHKVAKKKPSPVCQSCHGDPHGKRFDQNECKNCHGLGGSKKVQFAHEKRTGFALTGSHAQATCRSCHRGNTPKIFEKFETPDCMSCHRHTNAHNGEFKDKGCLNCHLEGGNKGLKFNHLVDARFKTTGFHGELEQAGKCQKCHPRNQFRTGKLNCVDCHKDSHNGELGPKCERCHLDTVHFKETVIDHDTQTQFPLVARHKQTECKKCHEDRHYKNGKLACFDCHEKDDPHALRLGKECAKCHIPDKGAPKFMHEEMTAFERTGKHLEAQCQLCHRLSMPGGVPPKVGWASTLPPEPLDRKFPTPGKACKNCHFDPHAGNNGEACESCHTTSSFNEASRAVHDTGAFRLQGTHDVIPCARCHQPRRTLAGLGSQCGQCHRADDAHNNALGEQCGNCHSQLGWLPARFDHTTTGFPLRGSHRTARCEDCHTIGRYAGTPTDCRACHQMETARVADPVHNDALTDCGNCHSEIGFSPARRYHPWFTLSGAHAVNRCSSCHLSGRYTGTPNQCVECHRAAYVDPSNQPNHILSGYSETCDECHTTAAWQPARRP